MPVKYKMDFNCQSDLDFVLCETSRMGDPELMAMAERLRKARIRARFPEAALAALSLGQPKSTYTHHENANRGFRKHAPHYARRFGVNLEWLLTGRGEMLAPASPAASIPIDGLIGAGAVVTMLAEQEAITRYGQISLPGDGHLGALLVEGESQIPRWYPGEAIIYDRRPVNLDDLVDTYCVLTDLDGAFWVKILRRGGAPGFWQLDSHNAQPRRRVALLGGHRIIATVHRHPSDMETEVARPRGRR